MSPTTTPADRRRRAATPAPEGRRSAVSRPGGVEPGERSGSSPGSRPVPTLAGEVRGSVLLFAFALLVTLGATAAARVLAGLAP